MGNEMGNNNVSGLQEQDKTDVEAPNKSQDFHEKDTGLNSEEPSGVSDSHVEKESSDIREPVKSKVEASDGTSKAPLVSEDTDSASEKNPSGTSDHQIQKETSIRKEGEESKKSSTRDTESMESVSQPDEPSMEDDNELQGSKEGILGSNGSHVTEKKEQKLHDISTIEVAKSRDDTLIEKEMESQKGNNDEHITETSNGVEVGKTITLLNDAEKGDKEQQFVRLNSFRKDFKDLETKEVSSTESLESFQVKTSVSNPKHIIPAEDTKVVENGTEIEEKEFIHKTFPLSNCSVEESKADKMDIGQNEFMKTGTDHEQNKGSEVDASFNSGIMRESQIDDSNVIENGYQVNFPDYKTSLVCENNCMDLEKEEKFFEISTTTASTDANTNKEKVEAEMMGKADDHDKVEREIVKSDLSPNQIDSEFLTIETSTQLEEVGISMDRSQVNESTRDLTDSTFGHDSNKVFGTAKDNEGSNTGQKQEDLNTKFDVKAESSFHAENGIAHTEDPVMGSRKQDSKNNPLLHQTVSVEAKQSAESFTTESNSESLKINAEVTEVSSYDFLQLDATSGDSDRTPLLNQVKTSKSDVIGRNPILETEFVALEPEERSVEKQVIALERTSTEKLKAPLLNFMKEENHVIESPKKQEKIGANKEIIDTSPPERKKQKPKYSLFSNCMCCTAVIQ
ncbi:hypothetical protein BVC80_1751g37 [Macleaya cordata]|uniref:Uncharacterized protein n=1 Tax=Macleaya cordata TaxID=56857 RepID=A0A200QHE9_MACCD|nr:hypothetical protein BVC80_1751g37 [Macleaya cordata]